jgi:hypothetical protein
MANGKLPSRSGNLLDVFGEGLVGGHGEMGLQKSGVELLVAALAAFVLHNGRGDEARLRRHFLEQEFQLAALPEIKNC